jgi:hypothetical protein
MVNDSSIARARIVRWIRGKSHNLLINRISMTDYSAFGLTLRVALAGDRRRCAASSNRLYCLSAVRIDSSNIRQQWAYDQPFGADWLPGTEPKSTTKGREFQRFWIPMSWDTPKSIPVKWWLLPNVVRRSR